jgi:uncharacterized protein YcsI (UPF0317 family)
MGMIAHTTGMTSAPGILREAIRSGRFSGPTSGQAAGHLQGNLVILPERMAADFLRYCVRNPKPCPLMAVGEPGEPGLPILGSNLDVRTDLPRYRVFRDGEHVASPADLISDWRDDLVPFVLGCSFSFEAALMRAGIRVAHIEAGRNVPMYITSLETRQAGPFGGPTVVSMRVFKPADAISAIVLSNRYPLAHGAPLHIGAPTAIGIPDITRPDFGDPPVLCEGDVPVFWACGVTPQMAIRLARPDLAITHEPGCMLVTDLLADEAR